MNDTVFKSKLLAPGTWAIQGAGATAYLVVGSERGMMIDTGEAEENLHDYVMTLTDKPVQWAANTHGHFDHTGGNGFFNAAFLGKLAAEIAKIPNGPTGRVVSNPTDYPIIVIDEGFKFDLGNRIIEAVRIGGHSPDALAYIDHGQRILFGGDSITNIVPLRYKRPDIQPGMLRYVMSLSRIMARRNEFDHVCGGHTNELLDGQLVNHLMMAALRALDGETDAPDAPRPDRKDRGPFKLLDPEDDGLIMYKDAKIMFDKRFVNSDADELTIKDT